MRLFPGNIDNVALLTATVPLLLFYHNLAQGGQITGDILCKIRFR